VVKEAEREHLQGVIENSSRSIPVGTRRCTLMMRKREAQSPLNSISEYANWLVLQHGARIVGGIC